MKKTNEKTDVKPNESNVNSVIPTEQIESHPLFFSAKLNDKYYLSAFGHILTPDGFSTKEELRTYLDVNITFLLEVASICAFYQIQKNINQKPE